MFKRDAVVWQGESIDRAVMIDKIFFLEITFVAYMVYSFSKKSFVLFKERAVFISKTVLFIFVSLTSSTLVRLDRIHNALEWYTTSYFFKNKLYIFSFTYCNLKRSVL